MIKFTITGEPVAKGRPKATTRGGFVKMYTPKKTASYEKLVAEIANVQMTDKQPLTGPVSINLYAYMAIPKSKPKRWREAANLGMIIPTTKPDIDNLAKSVLDGINGIIFEDDKQVAQLNIQKWYSDRPRVEVVIQPLFSK